MPQIDRRDFLKHTVLASAVASTAFSINAAGANERVVLGSMGVGGRGTFLATEFVKRDDVELRYMADPDSTRYEGAAGQVEAITGKRPTFHQDFRRILDDKEVDGIISATPDHWHALGTIWACQAGKDVYVEKPAAHSIWEGRKMVEAARKYNRVVQLGTQNRSAEYFYQALEHINSEAFGKVHFIRVLNSKVRPTIGKLEDTDTPEGVDYNLWLGPAPLRRFNQNHFHYAWHWFWDYSGGDIINDGVHQIDIVHAMTGQKYPKSVCSTGGIHHFDDDQQTPDTHTVSWDFDKLTVAFEQIEWAPYMVKMNMEIRDLDVLPKWPFSGTRIEVYGTKQMMFFERHGGGYQVFDESGESAIIQHGNFSRSNTDHIANFIDCIRSRELPSADIEKGHLSTLMCQYGNIAYRTGRRLHIDPETEGFVNDDEANAYVKRTYREGFEVPEVV